MDVEGRVALQALSLKRLKDIYSSVVASSSSYSAFLTEEDVRQIITAYSTNQAAMKNEDFSNSMIAIGGSMQQAGDGIGFIMDQLSGLATDSRSDMEKTVSAVQNLGSAIGKAFSGDFIAYIMSTLIWM